VILAADFGAPRLSLAWCATLHPHSKPARRPRDHPMSKRLEAAACEWKSLLKKMVARCATALALPCRSFWPIQNNRASGEFGKFPVHRH